MIFQQFLKRFLFASIFSILAASCSTEVARLSQGVNDTPPHHVSRGYASIKEKQLKEAAKHFKRALELDAHYAPALAGKIILMAYKGMESHQGQAEKEDLATNLELSISYALLYAKNIQEDVTVHIAAIRAHMVLSFPENQWLDKAQHYYKKAMVFDAKGGELRYYMADAFNRAGQYNDAVSLYQEIIKDYPHYRYLASQEMEAVQSKMRAKPDFARGLDLVKQDTITRADFAALIVELELESIGQTSKNSQWQIIPIDIQDHPLEESIRQFLKFGIQGTEVSSLGYFQPDASVTRAEFALAFQDVYSRVFNDPSIPTRYIGQASPYSDVEASAFYFNAMHAANTLGFIKIVDPITMKMRPHQPVTPAEALITLRFLKEHLGSKHQ